MCRVWDEREGECDVVVGRMVEESGGVENMEFIVELDACECSI